MRSRRDSSCATSVAAKGILPGVNEVGTEQSSDADSDLIRLELGDELDVSIKSVVSQKDRGQRGREQLAFVDSGAVDTLLRRRYATVSSGEDREIKKRVLFKGVNGSHMKHHGQRRFRVKTSGGSNIYTTWEVAGVLQAVYHRHDAKPMR